MNSKFKSTAKVLETVWYAQEAIDRERETIDWAKIAENASRIIPSSTEELRVEIADHLWSGSHEGILRYFLPLDQTSQAIVLEALRMRLFE